MTVMSDFFFFPSMENRGCNLQDKKMNAYSKQCYNKLSAFQTQSLGCFIDKIVT